MNEVVIHLRIALLCLFPLKFIILARLHPFPSTPLVVHELTVFVCLGSTKTFQKNDLTLIWAKPAGLWDLLWFSRKYSLGFWASWLWWGASSGVLDTSLRTAVISVCLWWQCCTQNILSLVGAAEVSVEKEMQWLSTDDSRNKVLQFSLPFIK